MFEGKHIHFSPIDQKPLCSFSSKLCRQRRLNGFAFCIRHILEDSSAPFRVCSFVASSGQNKCTNVISIAHPKGLCNTHLQLAGFPAAKRDRRQPKKENGQNSSASSPNEKMSNQSNEPTSSSMEMSDGDPYTFSDDTELATKPDQILSENHQKPSDISSPPHNSSLAIEPLTPSSTSSSSVDSNTEINVCKSLAPIPHLVNNGIKANPRTKSDAKTKSVAISRKKKALAAAVASKPSTGTYRLPAVLQQLEDSIHGNKAQYLLPKIIDESDDEEISSFGGGLSRYVSVIPLRSTTDSPRAFKLERSKREFRHRYLQLAQMINAEDKFRGLHQSTVANKLVEAARRCPNETGMLLQGRHPASSSNGLSPSSIKIFSKRRCSFRRASSTNGAKDAGCPELCLPCSTLCNRHILYSVDQQLFEFCSARGTAGSTPCGAPVLAIHSGLPYCPAHAEQVDGIGNNFSVSANAPKTLEGPDLSGNNGGGHQGSLSSKSNRRKARARSTSSLGRHSRRLRNRRRAKRIGSSGGSETRIHCIEAADNGMELDVETVDSPENCSPAYPTPAQLIPHTIQPLSNPLPTSVDHEVEILEDHDLKELLNRLPDEAFQEIFAMTQAAASSSRNGGLFVPMPSREEAEELERVLAVAESATMGGVGHTESDLSDLSLIDDHTLALAHDLITLGAGASGQSLLMGNEVVPGSNHLYMDNLSIPHQTIHPDTFTTEESFSSSPMLSRRKSLSMIPGGQQASPARGSSPPSLNQHHHDSSFIEDREGAAAHPL